LYNLTVDSSKIPLWIGEFGGVTVEIKDQDSLADLGLVLDLLDRYKLGWAYWSPAETSRGPTLVDDNGENSPLLTAILVRAYPTSYTTRNLAFFYNSTPRSHLEGIATSEGVVRVSVPPMLTSTIARCINCALFQDDKGSSLTIQLAANTMCHFYLDTPETLVRLR
jgi:hypothetical protein